MLVAEVAEVSVDSLFGKVIVGLFLALRDGDAEVVGRLQEPRRIKFKVDLFELLETPDVPNVVLSPTLALRLFFDS